LGKAWTAQPAESRVDIIGQREYWNGRGSMAIVLLILCGNLGAASHILPRKYYVATATIESILVAAAALNRIGRLLIHRALEQPFFSRLIEWDI